MLIIVKDGRVIFFLSKWGGIFGFLSSIWGHFLKKSVFCPITALKSDFGYTINKKPYIPHSTILILQLGPIMGQKYHFLGIFEKISHRVCRGVHFLHENAKDGGGHLQ